MAVKASGANVNLRLRGTAGDGETDINEEINGESTDANANVSLATLSTGAGFTDADGHKMSEFFGYSSVPPATLLANYTFNNTLANSAGTLGTLLKGSASYQAGRFSNAITFANGNTASETSTFYGNIWTAMTRSNFTSGSFALWFKVSSLNRRNILLYNEKCPWLSLELYANNQLYIGPGQNPIWSVTTFGTSDVVFACGTAERTGGTGNTQTVSATLYFGLAGGTLQSVSGGATHTENTYITTSCFGHAGTSVGFGGWIDQARFYSGVLTASEVQALYTE